MDIFLLCLVFWNHYFLATFVPSSFKLSLTPKKAFTQTLLSLMFDILLAATDGVGIPKYPHTYRGQLGVLHQGEPRTCCLPPLLYRSQAWTGDGPQAAPVWQNSGIQVYYIHFNIYWFFLLIVTINQMYYEWKSFSSIFHILSAEKKPRVYVCAITPLCQLLGGWGAWRFLGMNSACLRTKAS